MDKIKSSLWKKLEWMLVAKDSAETLSDSADNIFIPSLSLGNNTGSNAHHDGSLVSTSNDESSSSNTHVYPNAGHQSDIKKIEAISTEYSGSNRLSEDQDTSTMSSLQFATLTKLSIHNFSDQAHHCHESSILSILSPTNQSIALIDTSLQADINSNKKSGTQNIQNQSCNSTNNLINNKAGPVSLSLLFIPLSKVSNSPPPSISCSPIVPSTPSSTTSTDSIPTSATRVKGRFTVTVEKSYALRSPQRRRSRFSTIVEESDKQPGNMSSDNHCPEVVIPKEAEERRDSGFSAE